MVLSFCFCVPYCYSICRIQHYSTYRPFFAYLFFIPLPYSEFSLIRVLITNSLPLVFIALTYSFATNIRQQTCLPYPVTFLCPSYVRLLFYIYTYHLNYLSYSNVYLLSIPLPHFRYQISVSSILRMSTIFIQTHCSTWTNLIDLTYSNLFKPDFPHTFDLLVSNFSNRYSLDLNASPRYTCSNPTYPTSFKQSLTSLMICNEVMKWGVI